MQCSCAVHVDTRAHTIDARASRTAHSELRRYDGTLKCRIVTPARVARVLQRFDAMKASAVPASPQVSASVTHDFDALTAAALPNQQLGPAAAVDALWRAVFSLDQWLFIVHPNSAIDPRPFVAYEAGYVCLFAFTDGERLREFAKENAMLDEKGNALMLSVSPDTGIDWGHQEYQRGGRQRIHFDFGGPGWFAPLMGLPGIHRFVTEQIR